MVVWFVFSDDACNLLSRSVRLSFSLSLSLSLSRRRRCPLASRSSRLARALRRADFPRVFSRAKPFSLAAIFVVLATIAGTALLTLFYASILDLAKIFRDPFDNADYGRIRGGTRIEASAIETKRMKRNETNESVGQHTGCGTSHCATAAAFARGGGARGDRDAGRRACSLPNVAMASCGVCVCVCVG